MRFSKAITTVYRIGDVKFFEIDHKNSLIIIFKLIWVRCFRGAIVLVSFERLRGQNRQILQRLYDTPNNAGRITFASCVKY